MSVQYNDYIKEHKDNVKKAYEWLIINLPELFHDLETRSNYGWTMTTHDNSKYDKEEYDAYDEYFYGKNKSYKVVNDFKYAWLHHIHCNPHHWQHWVLINDDPDEGEIILDMPDEYIIEMICDWWSFSFKKGDLWEMFKWYDERSKYIRLSPNTRKKVINIFEKIQEKLTELKENEK